MPGSAQMTLRRRSFVGGILTAPAILGTASPGKSISEPDEWRSFDEYLKQRAAAGQFSGTVLVAKSGRRLLERGYGLADRGRGIPNTPRTKFCVASMGKMFTAVGIAQLVQRGRLSFGDTIGKYVPGIAPEIADRVTVAELLTHTSGMGDVLGSVGPDTPTTIDGLMALIVTQPLLFEPGTGYSYSNSGFIVLGALIEQVTGWRYDNYVHEHVFRPAGMTNTDVRAYEPGEIPGMAHGYTLTDSAPGTLTDNSGLIQIGNPS